MAAILASGPQIFAFAVRAAGEKSSANAFLRDLRAAGLGVRRAEGLKAFAQARNLVAERGAELARPLDSAPTFSEMGQWPTNGATGVLQHVQLIYRERETGNMKVVHYNMKGDSVVTRQAAIAAAIDANSEAADEYEQDLVGAAYTGSTLLVSTAAA